MVGGAKPRRGGVWGGVPLPTKNDGAHRGAMHPINPWEKCPAPAETARLGARTVPSIVRGAFPTGR